MFALTPAGYHSTVHQKYHCVCGNVLLREPHSTGQVRPQAGGIVIPLRVCACVCACVCTSQTTYTGKCSLSVHVDYPTREGVRACVRVCAYVLVKGCM